MSVMKELAHSFASVIAACPGSSALVRKSALAPVKLKTRFFQRAMSAIATRTRIQGALLETNFGISDGLRLLVPSSKIGLLFGRPSHHVSERATVELARLLALQSKAFIDVGANEGLFTFTVAEALGPQSHCKLHAFEPDPAVFDRLAANLRRNNIAARIHRAAVSDRTGKQTFYCNLADDLSGSLTTHFIDKHETVAVETDVTTLARYLELHDVRHACVKVDAEGAGELVWRGMRGACDRIDWLIFEIIGPELQAGLPARIIAESGWYAYYIRDYELVRSRAGEFEYKAPFYNWLFCAADLRARPDVLEGGAFKLIEPPA